MGKKKYFNTGHLKVGKNCEVQSKIRKKIVKTNNI